MKISKVSLLLGTAIFAPSILLSGQAMAQDSEQAQSQSRYALDEIVVSARRVEEGLQEAPLAITAISGLELENRGVLDVLDVADIAPNVSIKSNGTNGGLGAAPRTSIRGVGQSDFVINTDPAVGMYADGVYLGRSIGSVLDLVDVERVEVLRGPQGTLFGRNSTGGAVNVIAKKPEIGGGTNGYVSGTVGEEGYTLFRGGLNFELGDTAAIRVNAMKKDRDGFIPALQYDDLALGAEDVFAARAALRWEPTPSLTVDLDADFSTRSDSPAPFIPVLLGDLGANETNINAAGGGPLQRGVSTSVFARRYNGEGFAPAFSPNLLAYSAISPVPVFSADAMCSDPTYRDTSLTCLGQAWAASRDGTNQAWFDADANLITPDDQSVDTYGYSGQINWENENFSVKSITSVRGFESSFLNGSPAPIYIATNNNKQFDQDQFSQEITVNASLSDRLDILAGFYYFEEDGVEVVETVFPLAPPAGNNAIDFLPLNGFEDRNIENTSLAFFGQVNFDITDQLELTVGARHTDEEKYVLINKIENEAGVISTVLEGTEEIKEPSFLVNLAYQPTDDVMLYGQYSDGFRSGGFPARTPPGSGLSFDEVRYGPEFVESFEIGAKTTLLDGRLRANLALFSSDYTDQQINATALDPIGGGNTTTIQNIGESKIQGVEIEANLLVTDNFRVDLAMGYLDAKLEDITSGDGTLTINNGTNIARTISSDDDIELPHAPELQLNVGANYSYFLNNGDELRNRLDLFYESEQFGSIANYDFGLIPATTRVNYLMTYVPEDKPFKLAIGARNIFDAKDITNTFINTGPGVAGYHVLARGREAYVQLKYSFGN